MTTPTDAPTARLPVVDIARGVALIGMVIFHGTFDLEFFGRVAPGTIMQPFWMIFARLVAGSFVFLAGVSLVLAHGAGIRWRPFWRSTSIVALAAVAVSIATVIAMPHMFVFFGILHIIAVSRIVGLAFLRVPVAVIVVLAAIIWAAPYLITFEAFSARSLAWIGFARDVPLSMDLEPIFPWFAPFLLGMAWARLGLIPSWLTGSTGALIRGFTFAGRHSLVIYLLHQPLLLGTMWLVFVGLG